MIKDINICAKCVNFNLTFTKSSQKIFLKQSRKNTDDEINKRTVSDHILQKNDMIILLFFKQKDDN